MHSIIAGVGHYVPERVVTNLDLEKIMDTNDAWIRERTGIEERRWVELGKDNTTSMGVKAAKIAMERANLNPKDIDFLIFATLSPDYFFPGPATMAQRDLQLREIGALDVRVQCSGFLYGLSIADQFIKSGMYKNILVIGAETHSNLLDMSTRGRGVSVIFGDGASAAVVQASNEEGRGILSTHLHAQGEYADQLCLKEPGTSHEKRIYEGIHEDAENIYMYMNGNFVFKHAVTRFAEVIDEALKANNLKAEDLDMFIPHQANLRITQFVQKRLGLPEEKVYSNIQRFGNTSAATIPICLSELYEQGKLQKGSKVMMAAFGAGFTWASAMVVF